MKKIALLIVVISVMGLCTICEAVTITSFPWSADFSNTTWESQCKWTTGGASATTATSGGWNNNPYAQFVIGNTDGSYSAMGGFTFSGTANRVNVRYLLWASSDLVNVHHDPSFQPKILDWRAASGSRIHLHRWYARSCGWSFDTIQQGDAGARFSCESLPSPNHCNAVPCTFKLEDWVDQWISVEHEYNTVTQTYNIYVTTQDGTYDETLVVSGDTLSTAIGDIQYLGHYGYNSSRTSSTFFRISELTIGNAYIGPPTGFVNGQPDTTPPASPTGLSVM